MVGSVWRIGMMPYGGVGEVEKASVDFVSCLMGKLDLNDICTLVTLKCAVMCKVTGVLGFTRNSIVVVNTCMTLVAVGRTKLPA